jgi:hypothetical protein
MAFGMPRVQFERTGGAGRRTCAFRDVIWRRRPVTASLRYSVIKDLREFMSLRPDDNEYEPFFFRDKWRRFRFLDLTDGRLIDRRSGNARLEIPGN